MRRELDPTQAAPGERARLARTLATRALAGGLRAGEVVYYTKTGRAFDSGARIEYGSRGGK